MARWTRAIGWLDPGTRRVLDDGAAFGYTTTRVERSLRLRGGRPVVVGVEYDPGYVVKARADHPGLRIVRASAASLPFPDGAFDVVLLLDVLEHLPEERPALDEACRVLTEGGQLLLSVPYRGPLASADSLNLYSAIQRRIPGLLPLDPTERGHPRHRHYSLADLNAYFGGRFRIERVARTGLGVAEPINLALLLLCRGLLHCDAAYRVLRYVYYTAYLAEDLIPAGRYGYHLMVSARRLRESRPPGGSVGSAAVATRGATPA